MSIKSDRWIRQMAMEHGMIEPLIASLWPRQWSTSESPEAS
jgi:hypothetical protein